MSYFIRLIEQLPRLLNYGILNHCDSRCGPHVMLTHSDMENLLEMQGVAVGARIHIFLRTQRFLHTLLFEKPLGFPRWIWQESRIRGIQESFETALCTIPSSPVSEEA